MCITRVLRGSVCGRAIGASGAKRVLPSIARNVAIRAACFGAKNHKM
jgi:hypothetical protein